MSQLEKLKAGKRNTKIIKFPGTEQDIVINVLSNAERQDAHFAAERHFKGNHIEVSMVTVDAYEGEKSLQMIYRALKDADHQPIAKTVDAFRSLLTLDEKDFLIAEYIAFEKECSPVTEAILEEELDALIVSVKKNADETVGSVLSINIARKLIVSLVSRLQMQQKDNGFTSG
jgi:hypothetical protein